MLLIVTKPGKSKGQGTKARMRMGTGNLEGYPEKAILIIHSPSTHHLPNPKPPHSC